MIAVFDAKYHYDFWRPITAIRNGDIDDNPATERDATWQPIDDTPMHPEYPCAHCIVAASDGGVCSRRCSARRTCRKSPPPARPRPASRIAGPTCAPSSTEVSEARIWAGFHYRFSTRVGQDMGRKIGEYVVRNRLQPAVAGSR